MYIFFEWLFIIFFVGFIAVTIAFNTAHAMYFIKCFKIKKCSNKNCHFKEFCDKYEDVWMQEDIEKINKLIEEIR